eukprot:gene5283-6576_t
MASQVKQSQHERRKIRREYRLLIQDAQNNKQELIQPESKGLLDLLDRGDELYSSVEMPREAALDSEFLSLASQYGLEQAQRLKVSFNTFDSNGFITRLRDTLAQLSEDDEINPNGWMKLGERFSTIFSTTPKFDFMYGPMNLEIAEKKTKERKPREVVEKGPTKVATAERIKDNSNQENAETTSGRVQALKSFLERKKKVEFIDTVTSRDSFAGTVENIFYFSFLLKDGQASLKKDEQGRATIEVSQPPEEKDYVSGKATQRHSIIKLDYKTWQDMVKFADVEFDMEEEVMRTGPKRPRQEEEEVEEEEEEEEEEPSSKRNPKKRR